MLRPRARAAKASALAAESMSASLPLMSGNSSAAATQTTARRVRDMLEFSRIAGIFAPQGWPKAHGTDRRRSLQFRHVKILLGRRGRAGPRAQRRARGPGSKK